MRRATAVLSAAAVVLWTVGALAQAKPSFTGSWTPDTDKNAAAAPAGGGGGGRGGGGARPMTIKQDMATLTIERQAQGGQPSTPLTYKLDGSSMDITTGRGQAKATAKWEGNTIVITQVADAGTTKVVYAMEGDWLTTTTTAPGRGGGAATTTKLYYKKG